MLMIILSAFWRYIIENLIHHSWVGGRGRRTLINYLGNIPSPSFPCNPNPPYSFVSPSARQRSPFSPSCKISVMLRIRIQFKIRLDLELAGILIQLDWSQKILYIEKGTNYIHFQKGIPSLMAHKGPNFLWPWWPPRGPKVFKGKYREFQGGLRVLWNYQVLFSARGPYNQGGSVFLYMGPNFTWF